MHSQQDISTLKLTLIKNILLNHEATLPARAIEDITAANCVAQIWFILFSGRLFTHYHQLLAEGISPSASEMNQEIANEVNPWFWLMSSEGKPVFKMLLDNNILPTAEALTVRRSWDNTSTWYWLACSNLSEGVIELLLQKNILPTAETLAAKHTTNNTSAWYWWCYYDNNTNLMRRLFYNNIFPTATTLAERCATDNTCAWIWLTQDDARTAIFQMLLDKNILPSAQVLSERSLSDNSSTWYWLSMDIFETLLSKGIFPSAQILATRNSKSSLCAWRRLVLSQEGMAVFKTLLDNRIFPSVEALAERDAENTNMWYWLSGINGRIIFQKLLDNGIYPSAADLNATRTTHRSNAWFWLAHEHGIGIFLSLLAKDILPSAQGLAERRQLDNSSTWYWLATSDTKVSVFQMLIAKGIFPSAHILSEITDENNAWYWLAKTEKRLIVFETLLSHGITPPLDDWKYLCHPSIQHLRSPLGKQVIDRMSAVIQFTTTYNITHVGLMPNLLSRSDTLNFYSFLYLFYIKTATARNMPIPREIWFMIGRHLLPSYIAKYHFPELGSEANRTIFIRYHMINELDNYQHRHLAFFSKNKPRVVSLRQAIVEGGDVRKLFVQQFLMSRNPTKRFIQTPIKAHEYTYESKVTKKSDEKFANLLEDGCFLNPLKPRRAG